MKKKVLFIDRDGTILVEPGIENNEQIDRFELMHFVPGAITGLRNLCGLGFEMVIASNQDGLGTASFPEDTFWPYHNFMLETLEGEGVHFDDQLIDRHFPEDESPMRKPGTGMFGKYFGPEYDLAGSYVIGDRATDIALAYNLGAKGILLSDDRSVLDGKEYAGSCVFASSSWAEVAEFIRGSRRMAIVERCTSETDIKVRVDLDGHGESHIDTGLKFFDHMLNQLVHHGGLALELVCKGDLEVDEHHTIEDVGIALGEAIAAALGDKAGIDRYGFVLPMDECRAIALLDFGGRAELVWNVDFTREYVGDVPTEMFKHFFKSLSTAMRCNLYIAATGENNHHLAESVFKAFARALKQAARRNVFSYELPSSKGLL